jgi:hypothetical protein
LDFAPLIEQVLRGELTSVMLSPLAQLEVDKFNKPLLSPKRIRGGESDEDTEPGKKKSKQAEPDKNPAIVADWKIKPNENYSSVFYKNVKDKCPKLNGKTVCVKYHTMGRCNYVKKK